MHSLMKLLSTFFSHKTLIDHHVFPHCMLFSYKFVATKFFSRDKLSNRSHLIIYEVCIKTNCAIRPLIIKLIRCKDHM